MMLGGQELIVSEEKEEQSFKEATKNVFMRNTVVIDEASAMSEFILK